ncbi:MAG: arsenate reductase ArsC, partial [Acinetobacter pseudolwoffii]|nr:arsenate reductase ArsC [Acinetobacter pseudolwoffii]
IKAHWGLSDPSHLEVDKEEKMQAFMNTVEHINRRLDTLFKLNVDELSRSQLIAAINQISNVE